MNGQTTRLSEFHHVYQRGAPNAAVTLLLLHGTGGNEHDLLDVGRTLHPTANLLSPRGRVQERGMPRFFRRLAEGVFDVEDLKFRTQELAGFVRDASAEYRFDPGSVVALGFSNGANIAAAMLLLHPETLRGAALWRPMVPLTPAFAPDLSGRDILMINGAADQMVSSAQRETLAGMFENAGARLQRELVPAGHNLTQLDVDLTRRWLQNLTV